MSLATLGTLLSLASGLVKLGMMFFSFIDSKAKEKIGEDREKLKQLTALQGVSELLKSVDERFSRMTDEEVREEITKNNDWRD